MVNFGTKFAKDLLCHLVVDFRTKFAKILPTGFQMPWNKGAVSTVEALKIRQQELLQVRHFFDCELASRSYIYPKFPLVFSCGTTWWQNSELK